MAEQLDIVEKSKDAFLNLLSQLNDQQFHGFDSFVQSALEEYHSQIHTHNEHEHDDEDADMDVEQHNGSFQPVNDLKMMRLGRIVKDLRAKVPMSAEAPGEKTVIPDTKDFAEYNETNTVHVDGFLFSEEDVD
ncbi:unnamed protein product [Absidia cylindrospora]